MSNLMTKPLIETQELETIVGDRNVLLVDLGSKEDYDKAHIEGAVHCEYSSLISKEKPGTGKIANMDDLSSTLSAVGLTESRYVIAYDHQNGAQASRFLWTLDMVGHHHWSLLNGGFTAWEAESRPVHSLRTELIDPKSEPHSTDKKYLVSSMGAFRVEANDILDGLESSDRVIWDARSHEEYRGEKSPSARHGHIPGAVNLNWLNTIDMDNHRRLKPIDQLEDLLVNAGIDRDKEIIVHCQTHQRSSHSYVLLRHLGFQRVKAYDGSWAEWGNDPALPINTDL